jgi:phosphohistidine phosphatase
MKNIFFLRHAKSSWDDFALKDFDRPLSTRGIQDADLMGNFFRSKRVKLDLVLSSPSKRTKETIEHFFSRDKPKIDFSDTIYHASMEDILDNLYQIPEEVSNVMVVGHNPSMHDLTEFLSQKFLNKYPTCALAQISTANKWIELTQGCSNLENFMKPSELR